MRDSILRRGFDGLGASLAANTFKFADGDHHFLVGSSQGLEIKHLIFNFYHGAAPGSRPDPQLRWKLRHPPAEGAVEAILLTGTIGPLDDFTPIILSEPSGILGYHRMIELLFEEPFTAAALALLQLDFEIHFLDTAGTDEDKGIHEVPPTAPGMATRLIQ